MPPYFALFVAASLLASGEALLPVTVSDQVQIPDVTSTGSAQVNGLDKRFLRGREINDDEERTTWARIFGSDLTKAETKVYLKDWLKQGRGMEYVAEQMGMLGLTSEQMVNHINWKALRKYQRLHFEEKTGHKLPKRV